MFASSNNPTISQASGLMPGGFSVSQFLRLLRLSPLVLVTACAAPQQAGLPPAAPDEYSSLLYIAAGAGASSLEPTVEGAEDVFLEESNAAAGTITIGVDTSQRTSVELQFSDLGDAELNTGATIGYQASSVALSGRLFRKRSGLNLFAKIGAGTLLTEDSDLPGVNVITDNDFNLVTGVGIEFLSRRGAGVRLEYVGYDTDAQFAGLNFIYHFGGRSRSNRPAGPLVATPTTETQAPSLSEEIDLAPAPTPNSGPVVVDRPSIEPLPVETRPVPLLSLIHI